MRNHRVVSAKFRIVALFMMCVALLALTSCLEVKQKVVVNKDGSGHSFIEVSIQKDYAPMIVPKMKQDIPKGWTLVEEKEKEGSHVLLLKSEFKNIATLSDDEMKYAFSSSRKGVFKETYSFKMNQIKNSDAPFPFEFTVKVPGNIDSTNGNKISSDEVKWTLSGFRRGNELIVESSAYSTPILGVAGLIVFLLFSGIGFVVFKSIKKKEPITETSISRRFCGDCGIENTADAAFCTNCGQRIRTD